jgi:excisionase family DNA binding protein
MTEQMNTERLSTKSELAAHFQLKCNRTIENWMKAGIIPYVKIGRLVRFSIPEVDAALKERCGRNQ